MDARLCPTLCRFLAPLTLSTPARLLYPWDYSDKNTEMKWVAISFSRGSLPLRDPTQICSFCIGRWILLPLNHLGSPIYILWIYKYTHTLVFFHQRSSFLTTISEVGLTVFMLREGTTWGSERWSDPRSQSQQRWESNFQLSMFFFLFCKSLVLSTKINSFVLLFCLAFLSMKGCEIVISGGFEWVSLCESIPI